jgi:predicted transport protein
MTLRILAPAVYFGRVNVKAAPNLFMKDVYNIGGMRIQHMEVGTTGSVLPVVFDTVCREWPGDDG